MVCCVTICKISALCQMRENGYLASYSGVLSKPWKRGRRQHISTINEHSRYLLFLSCRSFHWQPSYLRSKKIGKTKKTIFEKNAHGYIVKWVTRADIDRIRHHMSAGSMPTIAVGRKDSSSDFYQITLQAPKVPKKRALNQVKRAKSMISPSIPTKTLSSILDLYCYV